MECDEYSDMSSAYSRAVFSVLSASSSRHRLDPVLCQCCVSSVLIGVGCCDGAGTRFVCPITSFML